MRRSSTGFHLLPPRRARIHGGALLLYMLLALLLTWPLVTHFTSHVPGDGIDDPALAWNLWWIQNRLVEQLNLDIFHADWMFHPININLAFYTLTPLNGLLSAPLQSAFGLIVASNLLLLSSFVLGAFGAYLLVYTLLAGHVFQESWPELARSKDCPVEGFGIHDPSPRAASDMRAPALAALLAGTVYAFASSKLFYASLGQFNIASSHWIPFCLLYLVRLYQAEAKGAALRNASFAALFLLFQAWSELTYASFLLIFITLFFLWHCLTRYRFLVLPYFVPMPYLLAGLIFAIGLAPFLWAMLPDLRNEGDFFASGGGFADTFSADLAGYLLPTRLHPFWGKWTAQLAFPNDKGQQVYVGYVASLLGGLGIWHSLRSGHRGLRQWGWFWLGGLLAFWLLTLGPRVRWMGADLPIAGPFALVSLLPFFSGNRYPSRYSVMVMICIAVLVGYGVHWLLGWLQARHGASTRLWAGVTALLMSLFVLEHLSLPLPINMSVTPPIYRQIAADPGDFTVLELPTGWRNGAYVLGRSDELIMMQQWYQSVHGKRRLGGNTSRNPAYKFDYFVNAPLIGDLIGLMNADRAWVGAAVTTHWDEIVARNRAVAGPVLHFLGVRYVTLHVEKSPDALTRFVQEVLPVALVDEWQGTDWQGEPSTIRLYRVHSAPAATGWQIDLAQPSAALYLAEGWMPAGYGNMRFATRKQVDLLLDLPAAGGTLEIELFGPAQSVEIGLAGRQLAQVPLVNAATSQTAMVVVPPGLATALVDRLEFRFGQSTLVSDLQRQLYESCNAKMVSPAVLLEKEIGCSHADLYISAIENQTGNLSILAYSAGEETGKRARIFVNGRNVALDQRGYNLAAVRSDGAVLESVAFDTHETDAAQTEVTASRQMAMWLALWPQGTLIAGAVRDEASQQLAQEAVDALRQVGVTTDLQGKFRWSHAFIGTVGGTAVESAALLRPAVVAVGLPANEETVSGGVGRIRFR